ncbi:prolyl oligopeptidase family protein [Jejuia pallidilutea]|uniref:Prolyl oligopeptidase family protein n=1 Tax=Jejuia pallidilutea TaxID=504487 RepID=A0A362XB26_9FLAO|nr:prolyl oligopeptidase family serine peptidase [Jejuia pallidilutea]PQV51421.1 prolyl oligopeptidase family protein [Jejuia pallidilutea]
MIQHSIKILLIFFCVGIHQLMGAQHQELYSKEYFVHQSDTLKYRMLLPEAFNESKQYPIVLFLHGAGERGNNNKSQLVHGSKIFTETVNRGAFPAIVIFPQCPKNSYWANAIVDRSSSPIKLEFPLNIEPTKPLDLVVKLMEEMVAKPYVDQQRVYVGGLSMGGMGTFEIVYRKPDFFAAAFSICGAGNPDATTKYAKTTPFWVFHGAKDDVVNPQSSVEMVEGILKNGGTPSFSLYANDNHNSWDSAFAEPQLLPWLFSNKKIKK